MTAPIGSLRWVPTSLDVGTHSLAFTAEDVDTGETLSGTSLVEVVSFVDSDSDGLTDVTESEYGTDGFVFDTDGDGVGDGDEVSDGTDPTDAADKDSDHDGHTDAEEAAAGTNPNDWWDKPSIVPNLTGAAWPETPANDAGSTCSWTVTRNAGPTMYYDQTVTWNREIENLLGMTIIVYGVQGYCEAYWGLRFLETWVDAERNSKNVSGELNCQSNLVVTNVVVCGTPEVWAEAQSQASVAVATDAAWNGSAEAQAAFLRHASCVEIALDFKHEIGVGKEVVAGALLNVKGVPIPTPVAAGGLVATPGAVARESADVGAATFDLWVGGAVYSSASAWTLSNGSTSSAKSNGKDSRVAITLRCKNVPGCHYTFRIVVESSDVSSQIRLVQ